MQATTILFGNRKGGTGKTTCAILLAKQLVKAGHKVLVIDTDDQQSIQRLSDDASGECVFELASFPQDITSKDQKRTFDGYMEDFRKDYDFIIMDQAGKLERSHKFDALMENANHIMVPCTPTEMSWNGTNDYLAYVLKLEGHPKISVFINMYYRGRKRSRLMKKEMKGLTEHGIHVFQNHVSQYEAIGELGVKGFETGNEMADLNVFNWTREVAAFLQTSAA